MSWNYFRMIKGGRNRMGQILIPKNIGGDPKELRRFTNLGKDKPPVTGRAWRLNELRLKSFNDLHKLWHVLLKERNTLHSDRIFSIQMQQHFYGYHDLQKVRLSLQRIQVVVGERAKIRNQYRIQLEREYIQKQRANDPSPMPVFDESTLFTEYTAPQRYIEDVETIRQETEESLAGKQSPLTKRDVLHYASIKAQKAGESVVGHFITSGKYANAQTVRSIESDINKQRAKAARKIFLKELVVVGKMLAAKK